MVKDEFLIAVDPKKSILPDSGATSGKILKDQVASAQDNKSKAFKSFAWSQPISQLGKTYFVLFKMNE